MLQVVDLTVKRGGRRVLDGISISVRPGERLAVHGPSGCGKTTLLYAIAGLLDVHHGVIRIGDRDVTHIPAHQRDVGLVFQDNQLFPHFDVADNVSYSLRVRGIGKRERRKVAEDWLSRFGLTGLARRRVTELSGGEAKRVALARTMAAAPRVVLLDEPLTGLDDSLHERLLGDIRDIFDSLGTTVVHVTHDRAEGSALCHRSINLATYPAE
jgi:thiamine transport system ATP-binding protein